MRTFALVSLALLLGACGQTHGADGAKPAAPASGARPAAETSVRTLPMAGDQPNQIVPPMSAGQMSAQQLDRVLAGDWRPDADKARDRYRHPRATLEFFGIRPDMTVIEITPGGGWYARILAPLLRDNGQYVAAVFAPSSGDYNSKQAETLHALFASRPDVFGKARVVGMDPKAPVLGPPGSADMVLTFRNVHNWVQAGTQDAMFKAFYDVLAPGGVLGVVDHRAAADTTLADSRGSGYLPQDAVVRMAERAGFELDAGSDINANPKDTRDYPKGVWTLPPTLTLGDRDRARYQAIGESDRMTLRFIKPEAPAQASSARP